MDFNQEVGEILGQNRITSEILCNMEKEEAFLVKCNKGSGKTFLARNFIEIINKKKRYKHLYLDNNKKIQLNKYEPFFCIPKEEFTIIRNIKHEVPEILDDYHITKAMLHILKIFNFRPKFMKLSVFNNEELDIVLFLNNEINKKRIFFICDNVNHWSDESRNLLLQVIRYKEKFKGFKYLKILILTDMEDSFFDDDVNLNLRMNPINEIKFKSVVSKLYPESNFTDQQIESIYNISGHDLKVINGLSEIMKNEQYINYSDLRNFVLTYFENKIDGGKEIISFLEKVAFLGEITLKKLLEKFMDIDDNKENGECLEKAFYLRVLSKENEYIRFINSIIYNSVTNSITNTDRKDEYRKLAECINTLFPSNYVLQSEYLTYAGDKTRAEIIYIVHCLQHYRNNKEKYSFYKLIFGVLKISNDLIDFYNRVIDLYDDYYGNKLTQEKLEKTIIKLFPKIQDFKELEFELDYLKSLFYINYSYKINDFERSINILKKWDTPDFKNCRCEMWVRNAILLMDLYYELSIEETRREEIQKELIKIGKDFNSDNYLKDMCYRLYLKANLYHEINIAFYKTTEAMDYFKNNKNSFNKQFYLISVINHSANCLVLNKLDDACLIIDDFIKDSEYSGFDQFYPELIGNNYLLSSYLNNRCSIKDALINFNKLTQFKSADNLLIRNNLVTIYAIDNNLDKACELSDTLYQQVLEDKDIDDYYKYYIINNYAVLSYVTGKKEKAIEAFSSIEDAFPVPNNKDYFIKRNNFIKTLFNDIGNQELLQDKNWNNYLITNNPKIIGDAWNFWGKLLLFSELQNWSDC